jgi:hypothetical protein
MRRHALWAVPLLLAVLTGLYVYLRVPREQELESVWTLGLKFLPFVFASLAIAWFPARSRGAVLLVVATLLPLMAVLVPRQAYLVVQAYEAAAPGVEKGARVGFDEYYTVHYTIVAYVMLAIPFAYRCGGGGAAGALKIAWAGMLLLLSGLEDIMYVVASGEPMPERVEWAEHVTVFLGHPPTSGELYVFCAIHFVLIAVLLALPLDRIGRRLGGAVRVHPPAPALRRPARG